jgi:very-short-patch-repair endonuclease
VAPRAPVPLTVFRVAHDLPALLGPHGVARVSDLAGRVDRHTVGRWVADRRLLRPYRGVVAWPPAWEDWQTRALAAVLATDGTLSHVSALRVWRVVSEEGPVHVAVPAGRRALHARGVVVHRVQDLVTDRLGPFPVTPLPRAPADTWALAHGSAGHVRTVEVSRAAVIDCLRDRRVTCAQVRAETSRRPALPGRRELAALVGLVEHGCQSELEIWGVREVLRAPGMPRFVQQHAVALPFATVHLDAAVPELEVAVELDGAAFHGSAEARERDTRRDVALAALGWVVLRFSYRRLTREGEACRREIIAVCRARRGQVSAR